MPDIVKMVKGNQEATAVRTAYEKVWKERGWKIKGEKPAPPKPSPEPRKNPPESENS